MSRRKAYPHTGITLFDTLHAKAAGNMQRRCPVLYNPSGRKKKICLTYFEIGQTYFKIPQTYFFGGVFPGTGKQTATRVQYTSGTSPAARLTTHRSYTLTRENKTPESQKRHSNKGQRLKPPHEIQRSNRPERSMQAPRNASARGPHTARATPVRS